MIDNAQPKILLIEDDEVYRRTLFSSLGYNFDIFEAENGEMAMEKILFHQPNVVILDIMMPKVDGFQVLDRLRNYPEPAIAQTPVIVLTNLSNPDDIVKAGQYGVVNYFVKSNTQMEEVAGAIQQILVNATAAT